MKKRAFGDIAGKVCVLLILTLSLLVTALVRGQVTSLYSHWKKQQMVQRPGEFQNTRAAPIRIVEFLATGIEPLIADFFWVKATTMNADQVFEITKQKAAAGKGLMVQAEVARTPKDDRDLFDLLCVIGRLDPHFEYAYYYGGNLLAWDGNTDFAITLLEKGLRNNPDSAMLASSLSFTYYYFMKDWEKGAEYAERSYLISGKYSSTPKAVAQFYAAGRNYDLAIRFLANILNFTTDPDTRGQLEDQIRYLIVEKDIASLEKAVAGFKIRFGRKPENLAELVEKGIIKEIPKDPFGGGFIMKKDSSVENQPRMRFDHYKKMREYLQETPAEGRKRVKSD